MAKKSNNPFRGFVDSISEANRMQQHWMAGPESDTRERSHADAWVPTTDIYANSEGDLVIRCELAGVSRDSLEITFSGGVLSISGERKDQPDSVTYYAHERQYGTFRRSMTLPEGIRDENIDANFEDGMLEVLVKGGAASQQPSQIEIGG